MGKSVSERKYYTEFVTSGYRLGEQAQAYILLRFEIAYKNIVAFLKLTTLVLP